jgi:thiamine-phosphate pyrophosphorylase
VRAIGPLLVLTDRVRAEAAGRSLADNVAAAVLAGARVVILREKDLPRDERRALARALLERLDPVDGALIVASDAALAREVGAAGVHLAAADPWPAADGLRVGVSCHSAADVEAARRRGAAYATLSPIFPTASKPGYGPALGVAALGGHGLPVYALGGIGPGNAAACVAAGAAGVAVMGAVMDDPGSVRAILAALSR